MSGIVSLTSIPSETATGMMEESLLRTLILRFAPGRTMHPLSAVLTTYVASPSVRTNCLLCECPLFRRTIPGTTARLFPWEYVLATPSGTPWPTSRFVAPPLQLWRWAMISIRAL